MRGQYAATPALSTSTSRPSRRNSSSSREAKQSSYSTPRASVNESPRSTMRASDAVTGDTSRMRASRNPAEFTA
jgi:hypothetical protein